MTDKPYVTIGIDPSITVQDLSHAAASINAVIRLAGAGLIMEKRGERITVGNAKTGEAMVIFQEPPAGFGSVEND